EARIELEGKEVRMDSAIGDAKNVLKHISSMLEVGGDGPHGATTSQAPTATGLGESRKALQDKLRMTMIKKHALPLYVTEMKRAFREV
ncbi:unnamed protein product, partial [Chrysoparadoxa australica]